MNRPLTLLTVPLLALATLTCSMEETPAAATAPDVAALADREIFEPQLAVEDDGTLLMVWREKGETGFDVFVS